MIFFRNSLNVFEVKGSFSNCYVFSIHVKNLLYIYVPPERVQNFLKNFMLMRLQKSALKCSEDCQTLIRFPEVILCSLNYHEDPQSCIEHPLLRSYLNISNVSWVFTKFSEKITAFLLSFLNSYVVTRTSTWRFTIISEVEGKLLKS